MPEADSDALPRESSPRAQAVLAIETLGSALDLGIRWVSQPSVEALFKALRQGQGDLVGLPALAHARPGVLTSTPLSRDAIVLVTRKGAARKLGPAASAAGKARGASPLPLRQVVIAGRGRVGEAFAELAGKLAPGLAVEPTRMDAQVDDLLERVGAGELEATIALESEVSAYRAYRHDVEVARVLAAKVPLAYAVRPGATRLLDAINGYLYQQALSAHRKESFGGDLAEVKKRRVLRVAMLNNALAYFIYRGQEVGLQCELAALLASSLGVRLEIVVPDQPSGLTRLLVENHADLAMITPNPADPHAKDLLLSEPIMWSDHVLVQRRGERPITRPEELDGKQVHVRRTSLYQASLEALQGKAPGLSVVAADEGLETEDLIGQVERGEIPMTVANSVLLRVEQGYRSQVQGTLVLARQIPLVLATRTSAKKLLQRVNGFIQGNCHGAWFAGLLSKYVEQGERLAEARSGAVGQPGRISPYDALVRRFGQKHGIDWRLISAQMYQESRFDPKAKSWVGALGLMQVMPATGAEMGFSDLYEPEVNVQAGVQYLSKLMEGFEDTIPMKHRVRFALAAYNAGIGHVRDARLLARSLGLDPDHWFGSVEKAMLLLDKPKYYRSARHGFCRGLEPVTYVSRIQSKYDAFSALVPAAEPDEKK